jgi:dihydroxyacetone kinase
MLDSLVPAVDALTGASADSFEAAAAKAARAASEGAEATRDLVAHRGRASYVGGGGVGMIDPGAVGMAILFEALQRAVSETSHEAD